MAQAAVTSITRALPPFVRDPAIQLIGQECYTTLVYNFDLSDTRCLKYALSKGLGLGIVLGGSILKVPQILKIISAGSARGLSLPAYILETVAYAINLAYAVRHSFPFSTYGENLFLTVQNMLITCLIVAYGTRPLTTSGGVSSKAPQVLGTALVLTAGAYVLFQPSLVPEPALQLLQAASVPLSLSSKVPQIVENHRRRSTGQLSAFAVFNQFAGCLARLFTTATETDDMLVFSGFALAAAFNAVLVAQMIMYWKAPEGHPPATAIASKSTNAAWTDAEEKTDASSSATTAPATRISMTAASPSQTPTRDTFPASSPAAAAAAAGRGAAASSAGPKRWARKVD